MTTPDLCWDDVHVVDILRYHLDPITYRHVAEVVISDGNITIIDPSVDLADLTVVTP
ncbi:MAG: hypothetical protein WBA98_08190 [Gordonia sp. (in: high G+C Gram-positive bacteria)]|uniref:hypothetical protein n=1 Tax=Gordonia sp. (in: high G+C Gram-positive bacteria) TaxID=84139 RepID=UPI003C71EB73